MEKDKEIIDDFFPYWQEPTDEGYRLGMAIGKRLSELLSEGEGQVTRNDIERMKSELALTLRKESGNMMCHTSMAEVIEDIVAEHIENVINSFKEHQRGCLPMVKLVSRIEKEVLQIT